MTCRILQGSVLGPTLWNMRYDLVGLSLGCSTICYTDDTLIVVIGLSFEEALVRARNWEWL